MAKLVFYTVFAFAFLIGGSIYLLNIFPFRLFYSVLPVLALLPVYEWRIGTVEKTFLAFLLVILASAILNHVSPVQFFGFLRFLVIPYLVYYLCKNYISERNIRLIIRLSIVVACLQPPLVFLQQTFFGPINAVLPAATRYSFEDRLDFSFGSFYTSDDPAMSFFLMMIIVFLLFDNAHNYFIKNRLLLAGYLTLGVLLSNSQLSNILVLLIWLVLIFRRVRLKTMFGAVAIAGAAVLLVAALGFFDLLKWKVSQAFEQMSVNAIEDAAGKNFEEGRYERTAAIYYYLTQPLKILGDGPSAYYDAMHQEFSLGNTGQVFTLYAEVGLIGLLMGYLIFYEMSRRKTASRPMAVGGFLLISALTITSFVLSDASFLLAYNIFLRTNLVPPPEHLV